MQEPLRFFFKLLSQSKVATLASGGITETRHDSADASSPKLSHSKLLYVADKGHKCRYLIDTGAAVSVLPNSCANGISDAGSLPLVAANNSTIHTYGNCKRVIDVGLKREYPWTFIVADVQQPIIGADFLIHYNLLVDLRSRCLRDMRTGLAIAASLSSIKPLSLNRVDTVQNEYTKLLGQFPELTRPTTKGETVKHGITHKIVTKGHPVFARPRRLAPDKLVTGQTFQRFIDRVTRGLDFVFVYLDDLLVTSPDHITHKKHLRILFARLLEYGIIIGPEKCQFGTTELSFLGSPRLRRRHFAVTQRR